MYSYPSIYAIGHKELDELFDDPVLVEEKVDGSQFSFSLTKEGIYLWCPPQRHSAASFEVHFVSLKRNSSGPRYNAELPLVCLNGIRIIF